MSDISYNGLTVLWASNFVVFGYILFEPEELNLFRGTIRIFSPTLNLNPSQQGSFSPF